MKQTRPARAPSPVPSTGGRLELRKIQMTGGSSYTVTLPKDWVQGAELSPGDVIGFMKQDDGSLSVYPHARVAPTSDRIDIDLGAEPIESTFRRIVAAYLAGYDVIAIRSRKPITATARRAIQQAAKRIIGIEVIDDEPNVIVLRDFLDAREFPIERGLRRMATLTRAMQEDALRCFSGEVDELEANMQDRDDEVDRLYWMVNKQYHGVLRDSTYAQNMGLTASQALNHLLVARVIERVADHGMRLAENVNALRSSGSNPKLESRMEKQAKRAIAMFGDAIAAFHKHDVGEANRIIEDAKSFASSQESAIRELHSMGAADVVHVSFALDSIGRTAAYAADIAETAINHHVAMRG